MSEPTASASPHAPRFSLRDTAVLALLAVTLCLQIAAWTRETAHSEADAIEYVERAEAWVAGDALKYAAASRPFAYSLLFAPMFAVARALELDDVRPLFACARILQIVLGLALVAATVRLGQRLAGRRAGLAAGWLLATNPLFLHYSVSPVTGIPAALCLVLALDAIVRGEGARGGLWAGLWSGLALMFAFKSVIFAAVFGIALVAMKRWRGRASWLAFGASFAAMLALQIALDRWIYGHWGAGIGPYLASNALPIVGRWLWELHLRRIGAWLYTTAQELQGIAPSAIDYSLEGRQVQGRLYYFANLPRSILWPGIALAILGLPRVFRRGAGMSALVAIAVFAGLFVMSSKGAKNLRLMLPLLPFIAIVGAIGWEWLASGGHAARVAAAALLAAALPFGWFGLGQLELARYSGYWQAMRSLEADASRATDKPLRVAAAFDWAIYLREPPGVVHARLPYLLDRWDEFDVDARAAEQAALADLDVLLVHLPVIEKLPQLMAEIQPRFEVRGAYYDREHHGALGPVLVLRKISGAGRRFFEVLDALPTANAASAEAQFVARAPLEFARRDEAGNEERATLVSVERRRIEGSGLEWIEYTWRADSSFAHDYRIVSRITGPGEVHLWNDRHATAYGVVPTSAWTAGLLLREGCVVVPRELTDEQRTLRANAIEAGVDPSLAELWIALIEEREAGRPPLRLELVREHGTEPIRASLPRDHTTTDDGVRFTRDGLTFVGSIRP